MAKTVSSRRWLKEHFSDEYVKRAQKEGWRSRAIYKLQEIDERDHLLKSGMTVIDLGAAPGGWTQYAMHKVTDQGKVIALDILPMDSIAGVTFIQGDFREESVLQQLSDHLNGHLADVLLSDMAPNTSGVKGIDQPRIMYLLEIALEFANDHLKEGGCFLMKIFQGEGFEAYHKALRQRFDSVATRKPKASRGRSPEIYLLAKGFKGRESIAE